MKYYHTLQMNLDPVELVSEDIKDNYPFLLEVSVILSELYTNLKLVDNLTQWNTDISPDYGILTYKTKKGNEGELKILPSINNSKEKYNSKDMENYRITSALLDGKSIDCEQTSGEYSFEIRKYLKELNE